MKSTSLLDTWLAAMQSWRKGPLLYGKMASSRSPCRAWRARSRFG